MWTNVRFGDFTFNRQRRELRRSGAIVRISNKALEALAVLISSAGVTVSKNDLYTALWGDKIVDEANLTQTIFCLRKALGRKDGQSPIKTISGIGYTFVENVSACPPDFESVSTRGLITTTTDTTNPEVGSLAAVRRLLICGRHDESRELLQSLAPKHLDFRNAATFFSLRARARMDAGDEALARRDLGEVIRISKSLEGASSSTILEASVAEGYLAYRNGQRTTAIETVRSAIDGLPTRLPEPSETRLLAQALIELATQELELGSHRDAFAHLARADSALRSLQDPPTSDLCQILIQSADGFASSSTDFSRANSCAREALRLAQWHGLDYEQVWAELTLAIIGQCAGTLQEARRHALCALALAQASLEGDQLARAYFIASRIETACGNGVGALALLQQAWPLIKHDPLMRGIFSICEARTRREVGDEQGTEIAASRAIDVIERQGSSHYIGLAYLARAWARRVRRKAEAIGDIEQAIEYLRRGAILADLAASLQLAYELTGNSMHRREALELTNSISSPV